MAKQEPQRATDSADGLEPQRATDSPDGQMPPMTSIRQLGVGLWTFGEDAEFGKKILLNGEQADGGEATLADWHGGVFKVKNKLDEWYAWDKDARKWQPTAAPAP